MMKSISFLPVLLLLAAMCFWGCPTNPQTPPKIEMLQELKDYTLFQAGSYWIYKDSLSNDMDSVYVVSTEDFEVTDDPVYGNCTISGTNVNMYSTFYKMNAHQGFALYCHLPKSQWIFINSETSTIFFGGLRYDKDNHERDIVYGDKSWYTRYDTLYNQYNLHSNTYHKVKKFSISEISFSSTNIPKTSYHSPHIGIIKKEMFDGKKWELLRYHVIQ